MFWEYFGDILSILGVLWGIVGVIGGMLGVFRHTNLLLYQKKCLEKEKCQLERKLPNG